MKYIPRFGRFAGRNENWYLKLEKSVKIFEFVAKNRLQPKIVAIQAEYTSNSRLLRYFAQSNPADFSEDSLTLLEAALLRRQEMLVGQMADIRSMSLDDIRAKLELWVEEIDDSEEFDARSKIVLSVLDDIRSFSA